MNLPTLACLAIATQAQRTPHVLPQRCAWRVHSSRPQSDAEHVLHAEQQAARVLHHVLDTLQERHRLATVNQPVCQGHNQHGQHERRLDSMQVGT